MTELALWTGRWTCFEDDGLLGRVKGGKSHKEQKRGETGVDRRRGSNEGVEGEEEGMERKWVTGEGKCRMKETFKGIQ